MYVRGVEGGAALGEREAQSGFFARGLIDPDSPPELIDVHAEDRQADAVAGDPGDRAS